TLAGAALAQGIRYPASARSDQTDDYHGTRVADPYRWLEEGGSPETRAWINEQNAVTSKYLKALPEREAIRARLTQLIDYARYRAPFRRAGRYFSLKNDGLQNQYVLYVQEGAAGAPRALIDPNKLSSDGTIALM